MATKMNRKMLWIVAAVLIFGQPVYRWVATSLSGSSPYQPTSATSVKIGPVQPALPTDAEGPSSQSTTSWVGFKSMLTPELTTIEVHQGQMVDIRASGQGVWKNLQSAGYEECGPDGTPPVDRADYFSNIGDYQCPIAQKGALIAKYGQNGAWFPVGKHFQRRAPKSCLLILGINDQKPENGSQNWADNSGGDYVTITLSQ